MGVLLTLWNALVVGLVWYIIGGLAYSHGGVGCWMACLPVLLWISVATGWGVGDMVYSWEKRQ